MSTHPRPILKRLFSSEKQTNYHQHQQPLPFATCVRIASPHVHFPPTPSMVASTHPAHSPHTYDRKPIVISPNHVAPPQAGSRKLYSPPVDFEVERSERGRDRQARPSPAKVEHTVKGSYFHPRAYEASELEPLPADAFQISPPLHVRRSPYSSDQYDSDVDSSDDESITTPPDAKSPAAVVIVDPQCASQPLDDAHSVDGVERPALVRSSKRPSIQLSSSREHSLTLDEGCLGGF